MRESKDRSVAIISDHVSIISIDNFFPLITYIRKNIYRTLSQQYIFHYLSGIKREECVAPIPGRPCFTGLYVIANSPR